MRVPREETTMLNEAFSVWTAPEDGVLPKMFGAMDSSAAAFQLKEALELAGVSFVKVIDNASGTELRNPGP
jgi:hypothetical protein